MVLADWSSAGGSPAPDPATRSINLEAFMLLSWLRSRRSRTKASRPARPRRSFCKLHVEELESRLAPSATRLLGGLEFSTSGDFTSTTSSTGTLISTTNPVQVGVAPATGQTFTPTLQFDGGV